MLALIDGDVVLHSAMWETTSLEEFKKRVHHFIDDWTMGAWCDDYVIALGAPDGTNYRDDLFHDYKKSVTRSKSRKKRPEHFDSAKEWISTLDNVIVADNNEADDLLGIWHCQIPESSVIVSSDKDLSQIPGNHYNPHYMKEEYFINTKEEANRFFLYQMLVGDSIDNIPGIPGIGPAKAKPIFDSGDNIAQSVIDAYKKRFGDNWKDYFLINGKLLFIQRKDYEYFSLPLYQELFSKDEELIT